MDIYMRLGPPNFPDSKIPTLSEFGSDYKDYYFTGSDPLKGQCCIILYEEIEVGQINHNVIDAEYNVTDLDIWLCDLRFIGKGIGTEAIDIICYYIFNRFGCEQVMISPSNRNERAIKDQMQHIQNVSHHITVI